MLWDRCPKSTYCERPVVELAASFAVCEFNDGDTFVPRLLEDVDIRPGYFTLLGCKKSDNRRISTSATKCSEKTKNARKRLRNIRKRHIDQNEAVEGVSYASGQF